MALFMVVRKTDRLNERPVREIQLRAPFRILSA